MGGTAPSNVERLGALAPAPAGDFRDADRAAVFEEDRDADALSCRLAQCFAILNYSSVAPAGCAIEQTALLDACSFFC
jgi:hypothetical protein